MLGGGAGVLVQWLKLPAWEVGNRGFEPRSGIQVQTYKVFLPRSLVKIKYCGEPRNREVACSASDPQGPNFECGLKLHSFH